MPTLGNMLQAAGYYTSYKGKWHLAEINRKRDWNRVPNGIYPSTTNAMEGYGFHDYGFDGEAIGLTWDGYASDQVLAGDAARSILDFKATDKAGGKPWFMVVGLINPHDIMFFDATGKQSETRPHPEVLAPLRREPGDPLYAEDNKFPLPKSFADDLSTKPEAHSAIRRLTGQFFGEMPIDDTASWHRFRNYYYNCLRDVDRRLEQLLWSLKATDQLKDTIIIYTADHGERAGAHQLRQKAGTMYREETNVPMIIVHPDYPGGRATSGLMSAIDLAPTLMSLAGAPAGWQQEHFPGLPGVDVTPLLADPKRPTDRDRRGHLFNYAVAYMWEPKSGRRTASTEGPRDYDKVYDLTKRRLHRGVHDGRYKFARYFAPAHHHRPETWEVLSANNDLELYDTHADPDEMINLAGRPEYRETIMRLNAMVNALITREVGEDDGREYPGPTELYNQPV